MNYQEIEKLIKQASNIYIMGHNGIDLDAYGACLGMHYLANNFNKQSYIIMDEEQSDNSIIKTQEELLKRNIFVKTYKLNEIINTIDEKSLLIILDVNRKELLQNESVLKYIKNVIILDHHKESNDKINVIYKYIDENYSSTCEIVINLLKEFNITIPPYVSSIMLGGIVIDTNNFTLKTSDVTYENASHLIKAGADNKEVQYLLKENLEEYFKIQKNIEDVIIIDKKYAVCICDNEIHDKEFLAKIALTLLTFDDIEVSFSIGKITEDTIGISTRSIGNIDASSYMKKLGGGGHITDAACQISNISINEAKEKLLSIIKEG